MDKIRKASKISHDVIPDAILENYFCEICNKYLTVGPIGLHSLGGNICGRCLYGERDPPLTLFECAENNLNSTNFEEYIPITLFAYATDSQSLFPCINRYEGCTKLLPYTEIRAHERNCVYKSFNCPLCSYKGVGSQLVTHFKRHHRKSILEQPEFKISLYSNKDDRYLLRTDNHLFVICVKYAASNSLLKISYESLTNNSANKIELLFKLRSPTNHNCFEVLITKGSDRINRIQNNEINDVCHIFMNHSEVYCEIFTLNADKSCVDAE